MSENFTTESELSLTVPDSELRNVRQQIESTVGTTEVGLTDGGSMSAQASRGRGSGGGRARRRARRSYRMEISRTEYLEDAVVYLEEIEDKVGSGGEGGGILDDVLGAVVETGGDAALEIGDAAIDTFTNTVGTALGNTIANAVSNSELSVETVEPLRVERPDWVPIQVDSPDGGGDGGRPTVEVSPEFHPEFTSDVEVSPEFNPTFQPEFQPEFNPEFQNEFNPEITVSPEISLPDLLLGGRGGGGSRGPRSRPPSGDGSGDGVGTFSIGGDYGLEVAEGWVSIGGDNGIQAGTPPDQRNRSSNASNRSQRPRDVSFSTQTESRVTVDPSGLRDLRDDILDAFDDAVADTRSDLEGQISDLESEVEALRDDISGTYP